MSEQQAASHSEAQEAMLRSPETLSEWLSVKCKGVDQVAWAPPLRDVTPADFTSWTIGRLLSLSLDAGQKAYVRMAALDAIAAKFLNDPDIERQTDQLALQIEERRGEQEREDRLDLMDQQMGFPVLARLARFGGGV